MDPTPPSPNEKSSIRGEGTSHLMRQEQPVPHQQQNSCPSPPNPNSSVDDSIQQALEDTDTESEATDPETEIQRAFEAIDTLYHWDCSPSDTLTFTLSVPSYAQLRDRLEEEEGLLEYFDNKPWPEYSTRIRPQNLSDAIKAQLDIVAAENNGALLDIRKKLRDGRNTYCGKKKDVSKGHTAPDGQLRYRGFKDAPFVFEITHTKTKGNVEKKVEACFKGISSMCTILIINIIIPTPNERKLGLRYGATVSLWVAERAGTNKNTSMLQTLVNNELFRNKMGGALPGELKIPFKYLLPPEERTKNPAIPGAELTFSYQSLAKIIEDAEDNEREAAELSKPQRWELRDKNYKLVEVSPDEDPHADVRRRAQRTIDDLYHYARTLSGDLTFALSVLSYRKLRQDLRDKSLLGYFDNELRSDWNPESGKLTLRATVPSWVHEHVQQELHSTIAKELDKFANVSGLEKIVNKLRRDHHGLIGEKAAASQAYMSPDDQFSKLRAGFKYKATITLWEKSKGEQGDDEYDVIRRVCKRGELKIPIKLFLAPEDRTGSVAQDSVLTITHTTLENLIKKGEARFESSDDGQPTIVESSSMKRPRCRGIIDKGKEEPKAKRSKVAERPKPETAAATRSKKT
ncbi:hypothetical protein F4680DRAFT_442135 [Xylaria scruposa]|nr:hypothetical protein F4680DRAFT_442135 [Xylaria scruposa]